MKNKTWIPALPVIAVSFLLYLIVSTLQNEFFGDILSPFCALLASAIIFNTYFKSGRARKINRIWAALGMACLSWAAADILWALFDFVFHLDPQESVLISILYMGTNFFLFAAIFIYSVYKFRKWNAIQLVVDAVMISVTSIFLLWILFFDKDPEMFSRIGNEGWITSVSIIIDVAAFICIVVWCFSIHGGKLPRYLYVSIGSIFLYIVSDLYWFYLDINNTYAPNSLIDAAYMASLLGIAVAAEMFRADSGAGERDFSNVGSKNRGLFLLSGLLLTVVFKGFVLTDLLVFLFITLAYISFTVYIQGSIKSDQLLRKEYDLNAELESRIADRTKELDYLSNRDLVTNLYNRRSFIRRLTERLAMVQPGETIALLFIDVDRFKTINDMYGHFVGDQVLVELSKSLMRFKQPNNTLARLGGDEFIFAVHADYGYREAEKLAEQVVQACGETLNIGNYAFSLTVSVGISIYPLDAENSDMLLKNADIAMYQAKKLGCNKYVSFSEELSGAIQRKNEIEMLLKTVDYDQEFKLFYQPQFSIPDKKLIGMEALLRWNSPQKGFIPPDEFIPLAEETGCIMPIGDWVMQKAISQIDSWNHYYGMELQMGINVSPRQLDQSSFIHNLQSSMKAHHVNPQWVDIEITEGVAMADKYRMPEIANQFKDAGVSISIDDFGTGYSSLSCLKLFPFDRIKIAKPLIDAITSDNFDQNITKYTILMAKSVGIKTIAEGVESQKQFDLLTQLGCEQIQGYFLGRPVPPSKFEEEFLKDRTEYRLAAEA
ncbi:MAG TPA: EAL domain-containing protein [Clostridia bacterium]|nr:EAL domain-containing protein [Clostridia bacterium]